MTFEDFDKLQETLLGKVKDMKNTKGREYAGTSDRFDNFNRASSKIGIHRIQILMVYLAKHLDSIDTFVREFPKDKNYVKKLSEPIEGRIVDAITYLTLLAGMITEEKPVEKEKDTCRLPSTTPNNNQ